MKKIIISKGDVYYEKNDHKTADSLAYAVYSADTNANDSVCRF